ncbi:hypothetical protein FQN54_007675 [Arachnomyces sp. PD_36]|nr:hypothetical protein FQN54_007675 [Arachnomyces sp. PD_36]
MPSPETHITLNSIDINVGTPSSHPSQPPTTIFFIPGNPGLISYYDSFLPLLSRYLQSVDVGTSGAGNSVLNNTGFRICGSSLGGFEVEDGKSRSQGKALYSLKEQIEYVENSLWNVVKGIASSYTNTKPKVILMGHSVGAYITMEIIRRHRERETKAGLDQLDIIGAVLLFPTVVDIAKSPSGSKAMWIIDIPHLALIVSSLAKLIVFLVPVLLLRGLVGVAMGFPPAAAVDTTVNFLRSKRGVRQAIHMAVDEMREITSDKWSDDIWGTTASSETTNKKTSSPNLVFYFGRGDHWVAERTRDELIKARASLPDRNGKRNGPNMQVCEDGVLHGFCIRHNDIMAKKVAGFIHEIVDCVRN